MTKRYEQEIVRKLSSLLSNDITKTIEDLHFSEPLPNDLVNPLIKRQKYMGIESRLGNRLYSPIIDVAVGPYAIDRGFNYLYSGFLKKEITSNLLRNIAEKGFYLLMGRPGFTDRHEFTGSECMNQNNNPRCFLAIEIENRTSPKYFMGSSLNSSIMGKIGIVICEGESSRNIKNLFYYIDEMIHREKLPQIMKNVIWIKKEDFDRVIR